MLWDPRTQRLGLGELLATNISPAIRFSHGSRYVSDIVEMDRKAFPIEKGASGIDRIDEQLFSGTSSSAATTAAAEPRPAVVSYSGVTI